MKNEVKEIFDNYPMEHKNRLLEVRSLIFIVAKELSLDDKITESLKWGQPTYSVSSGTPIRIDRFDEKHIGIFFHCQTTLIGDLRALFPNKLLFSKNRAIVLDSEKDLPIDELKLCIEMALTYHLNKSRNNKSK